MSRAPYRREGQVGTYVSVYLSAPLYTALEERCAAENVSMLTWIRQRVLEACPIEEQPEPKPVRKSRAKDRTPKPPPPPPPPAPTEDDLVEKHRQRVLDLEARGYLPTAICAQTHLPYRLVDKILTTKAPPKRHPK